MKNVLKQERGVTLTALAVAIVILVVIVSMIVYNAKDTVKIKALTNMRNDISVLRDKISNYYINNGDIPKNKEYNVDKLLETEGDNKSNIFGANDIGKFYVIDLEKLDGLTLNLGEDYKEVSTVGSVGSLTDIYIINENSHNIFYVHGIKVDDKTYYTDYNASEKDTIEVETISADVINRNNMKTYDDLQDAIDEAGIGDEIQVLKDLDVTETIRVEQGKNIVLSIGNNTITSETTVIENSGTLTIKGGTISSKNGNGVDNSGILTLGENDDNVNQEPIIEASKYGVLTNRTGSSFYFYDGIIKGKEAAIQGEVSEIPKDYEIQKAEEDEYKIEKLRPIPQIGDYVEHDIDIDNDGDTTKDWRVFYKNEEYVFIIASNYLTNIELLEKTGLNMDQTNKSKVNLTTYGSRKGSESIDENIANKYMLKWKEIHPESTNTNIKAVSLLLDTNIWKEFTGGIEGADAIGAPTLEMYIASWNEKGYTKLFYNADDDYGYKIGTEESANNLYLDMSSDRGYDDTLYYPSKDVEYWLASPSAYDNERR